MKPVKGAYINNTGHPVDSKDLEELSNKDVFRLSEKIGEVVFVESKEVQKITLNGGSEFLWREKYPIHLRTGDFLRGFYQDNSKWLSGYEIMDKNKNIFERGGIKDIIFEE